MMDPNLLADAVGAGVLLAFGCIAINFILMMIRKGG